MADRRVFFFKSHIQWRSKKTTEKDHGKPDPLDPTADRDRGEADKASKSESDDQGRID